MKKSLRWWFFLLVGSIVGASLWLFFTTVAFAGECVLGPACPQTGDTALGGGVYVVTTGNLNDPFTLVPVSGTLVFLNGGIGFVVITSLATPPMFLQTGTIAGTGATLPLRGGETSHLIAELGMGLVPVVSGPEPGALYEIARNNFRTLQPDYAKLLGVKSIVGPDGKVYYGQVHHAIELDVLQKYPYVYTEKELNAFGNMRGIPPEPDGKQELHNSAIRSFWNRAYEKIDELITKDGLKPGMQAYNDLVKRELEHALWPASASGYAHMPSLPDSPGQREVCPASSISTPDATGHANCSEGDGSDQGNPLCPGNHAG